MLCRNFREQSNATHSPLGLLCVQECLEDGYDVLQSSQPRLQCRLDLRVVVTQLLVEVFAVWCGTHGGTEDWLDDEAVVWLKGVCIGSTEGVGEFFAVGGEVSTEGLGCEV